MAVSNSFLLFSASLFFFIVSPSIQASFKPKALVLPVTKDASTLQYVTRIKQRTPLVPVKLTLDLGGDMVWVDCENGYVSSSYEPVRCKSAPCKLARSKSCGDCFDGPKPGCNNNTCGLLPTNNVKGLGTSGEASLDVVSLQSTDGTNPGKEVSVPKFLFTCGSSFLLNGLARGVKGVAGLGRRSISMPSLFSAAFRFPKKFAICLSPTPGTDGVIFLGDGPYIFPPFETNNDVSKALTFTPLVLNPVSTAPVSFEGEPSSDYFIGVKGIDVFGIPVKLNKALLSINKEGSGGTKISTITPYTVMQTSIYKAVVNAFTQNTPRDARVPAVAPFSACYNTSRLSITPIGPAVPQIDLVMENDVKWTIHGPNAMVNVKKDVICLGFLDGGLEPTTSIVIGSHQIENNLLQFDLAASRLGFSSLLRFRYTACSDFNFTSVAQKRDWSF